MNNNFREYFSKNMMITLAFGIASGLPLALVFGTLSLWLKDFDIAYRTIGAFSLIRLPYSFKWLWAPVVENVKIPLLHKLGKRRSWAIFSQIGLIFSIILISLQNPSSNLALMAVFALCISFFSATQDIVLDAFRVELFSKTTNDEVNGATIYVLGYRLGTVISSAGAIGLASIYSWNVVYFIVGLFLLLGVFAVLVADEPCSTEKLNYEKGNILRTALVEPFTQFAKKEHWIVALFLVFLYRLSDSYFGTLAYPFYDDLGFSKVEIAHISKLYGMVATIIGGVLGGCIINKIGLSKGLVLFAIVQGVTTLFYIFLYSVGHNVWILMVSVSIDNLVSGMATTVIIAFMSVLCDKGYTATQYALLSSLMGLSRDVFASTAGRVLELTSWPVFFIITALLSVPGMFLSFYLYKKKPGYLLKA
ncbi:MAG: MFS transporter [Alphaproteobacteria bacterium]|nr:MFS transporter [Alphaproteobacteria bacterium]